MREGTSCYIQGASPERTARLRATVMEGCPQEGTCKGEFCGRDSKAKWLLQVGRGETLRESGRDRQWAARGSRRELCGTRRPALTSHGLFPLRTSREQEQHLCPARAVLAVCPGTDRAPVGSTCRHCRARATPATGIFWKREFPWDAGSLTTPLAAGPWKSNGGWGWCPPT